MTLEEYIIKSHLVLPKYTYNSVIELLVDSLRTDSEKGCIVRTKALFEKKTKQLITKSFQQIDCSLNRRWTKKEVLDSSLNFAYYLVNECGVKNGDTVCFVTNNSDIHAIGIVGVLAAGAIYSSMAEHSAERKSKIL